MSDLSTYLSSNGGELVLKGNDFQLTDSFFNMILFAWFGGNPGFVTTGRELVTEQRFDWWGNSLAFSNEKELQYNSQLENALNTTALTSASRGELEKIAKKDLEFLSTFANVEVSVVIISDNKVSIKATLTELDNLDQKEFQVIWDATKKEVIEQTIL
jgi:hypothetical protein